MSSRFASQGLRITILGAGAWGTALGIVLARNGHRLTLWGHHPGHLEDTRRDGVNHRYLPGVVLPRDWTYETDLLAASGDADVVVLAVPSHAFRQTAAALRGWKGRAVVSVTKGIEFETGLTMCGVLRQEIPGVAAGALSGPTLAIEVARGIPAAVVAASQDPEVAALTQQLFLAPRFRVYTSTDEVGVELGGALKNVVAIAAGVGDGLGFGDNSKAALVTRGIAEVRRIGVACGAKADSFGGLSGLGDLTVTCFSRLSRNRGLGERIGRGDSVAQVLAESVSVAEGYPTARAAWQLARAKNVETPIIDEVYSVLYEGRQPLEAVRSLMTRDAGAEV
ncbi:MAG: NAD(P)-dependent glycerol-3-phosphate dehydrogenase [Verrucomicrobia bacterium]|nr:NAD(P)-dependent glycerol-3-phosphate dehydrogenase [Verrucomicrobiota bacterium]